jgi:hypothetical protein
MNEPITLTLPHKELKCQLLVVSCRTRLIYEIKCLSDAEKERAIDDMIDRQIEQMIFASDFEGTR